MKTAPAQTQPQLTPAELFGEIERRKIDVTHRPHIWYASCITGEGRLLNAYADSPMLAVERLLWLTAKVEALADV